VTVNLTQREVEDMMMDVARLLLGIDDTDNASVRIPYGASSETGSAAAHSPEKSVCYVHVEPTDDGYGVQHHKSYQNGATESDGMTEVDEYTEEYAVIFSCYGPDSYDRARLIRDGLFSLEVKRMLGARRVYFKPSTPPLAQTHDVINTQWVKRCDLTATFYAYVRIERENAVQNIEQVNITIATPTKSLSYGEQTKGAYQWQYYR
jgi:hypothetical protein